MKKIFALILAIAMMASMSVVVFADSDAVDVGMTDTDDSGNLLGGTVLTYGVDQTYTITIPADQEFAFDRTEVDAAKAFKAAADIAASDVKIKGNQTLVVAVTSKNSWKLVDATGASTAVSYNVFVSENKTEAEAALGNDNAVLSVTVPADAPVTGAEKTNAMKFYTKGTAQVGEYQDQLTFKVVINGPTQA